MKNNILIHKNYSFSKIFLKFVFALIPLILYGFYKNGILLYLDGSINLISIFKPIIFPLIGVFSGLLINYIKDHKFVFNELVLYGLLVGMIIPLKTNVLIFLILLPLLLYATTILEKKIKINSVSLIKIAIIGILMILGSYEYGNINELNSVYAVSIIDILFGRGIGGVCSTSIFLIVAGFCYLLSDYYYKKEIPIAATLMYSFVCLLSFFIIQDFDVVINNLMNSAPLFAFVFIAPITIYSSYTPKGKILFGILIGLLSGLLVLVLGGNEAPIISIGVVSAFKDLIDNIATKKEKNK